MLLLNKKDLLKTIMHYLPADPTIIEAGAFTGKDTIKMASMWPNGLLYAFEPVPEIFAQLCANTKKFENIYPFKLALGIENGTFPFWPSEHPQKKGVFSQAGSLLAPDKRLLWSNIRFLKPISIDTITLASWAQQERIDHIDFLWLDLQGYELPVMQESAALIKAISLIYTEVHFTQAYAGQAQYHELKNWLESIDFTMIAKDFQDEATWFFGNALFINNRTRSGKYS